MRFYVVCEDRAHEQFIRGLLEGKGLIENWGREVRCITSPRGDAKQFVRRYFSEAVTTRRAKAFQNALAVLAMADGDNEGHRTRTDAMLQALVPPRADAERIAVLAPTWSIETWALFLGGDNSIAESRSYKSYSTSPDMRTIRAAGRAWEPPRPAEATQLQSLHAGRVEFARL